MRTAAMIIIIVLVLAVCGTVFLDYAPIEPQTQKIERTLPDESIER